MGKSTDVRYYCFDCQKWFSVKGFVAKELVQFEKNAFCTRCDKNNTSRSGKTLTVTRKPGSLSDPPSMAQINYIRALGGDPGKIKTKGEVSEYIAELKKEQGA